MKLISEETGRQCTRIRGNFAYSGCFIKLNCLNGRLSLQMDGSEWQTRLRIQTYFGLFVEVVQVAGASLVRTSPVGPYAVALNSVASATVRVYPAVSIGASLLTITPNASQNATALGINYLSLVGKYQNRLINTGIAVISFAFLDKYVLVCIILSCVWPINHPAPSVVLLAYQSR